MEHISKLETIFLSGSLTDLLNVVEASLLRGGTLPGDITCSEGVYCNVGTITDKPGCTNGGGCSSGSGCKIGGNPM
jgi:hypothetical protein